jgi:hypothetical protein
VFRDLHENFGAYVIIAIFGTALGLVCTPVMTVVLVNEVNINQQWRDYGTPATATVVFVCVTKSGKSCIKSELWTIRVEYPTDVGPRQSDLLLTTNRQPEVGDRIEIRYDRRNPGEATLAARSSGVALEASLLVLFALGLVLGLATTVALGRDRLATRRRQAA